MISYFLVQIRSWVLVSLAGMLAVSGAALALIHRSGGDARADDRVDTTVARDPGTVVYVETGSRVRDFIEDLERMNLTTGDTLLAALEQAAPSALPFSLPPAAAGARYEGLFPPGRYGFEPGVLRPLEPGRDTRRQAALNASLLAQRLLEAGAERYASLAAPRQETPGPAGSGTTGRGAASLQPYQRLILASIIEKEAVAGRQYRDVSAVLHSRLRSGTPLGSCPTVEYALGYHRPFLTREDLSIKSPYNVYVRTGLPPTPICFFSDEALQAAIDPSDITAFFFVFDWTSGRLLFSETYGEHLDKAHRARRNYAGLHGGQALRTRHQDKFYEP